MGIFNVGVTDKKRDKLVYARWQRMLERCYSPSYKEKFPSYNGVVVCNDFLYYSKFESWLKEQDNFYEYINGVVLWCSGYKYYYYIYKPLVCNILILNKKNTIFSDSTQATV